MLKVKSKPIEPYLYNIQPTYNNRVATEVGLWLFHKCNVMVYFVFIP